MIQNPFVSEYVRTYDNMISEEMCDKIIKIYNSHEHMAFQEETRDYKYGVLDLSLFPDLHPIGDYFIEMIKEAAKMYWEDTGIIPDFPYEFENVRIKKYTPNQNSRFDLHSDHDKASCPRFLICLCYLTTNEDGGFTNFPTLGKRVQSVKGRIAMFPPWFMFPHEAEPPRDHEKFILMSGLVYSEGHSANYLNDENYLNKIK